MSARTVVLGAALWASVLLVAPVTAQDAPASGSASDRSGGLVIGLGAGSGSHGIALLGDIGWRWSWLDVLLRGAGTTEFGPLVSDPPNSARDVALLVGAHAGSSRAWIRGALGPAAVWTTRRGELERCTGVVFRNCHYEEISARAMGLAFQADVVVVLTEGLGLGLGLLGDLNGEEHFEGMTFGVRLGDFGSRGAAAPRPSTTH